MLKNINKYTPTASTEDFQEESLNDQEVGAADLATAETEGTVVEPTGIQTNPDEIGTTPAPDAETPTDVVADVVAPVGDVTGDSPATGVVVEGVELAVGDGIPNSDQTVEGDLGGEVTSGDAPAAPTGETEELGVTNEPDDLDDSMALMDIPGTDGDMQDTAQELTDDDEKVLEDQLNETEEVTEALEAYIGQLKAAGLDGFSVQTASVLHVGLTSCKRRLGLEDLTTGLEGYHGDSRSALRRATVSMEDLKGTLAKGWERFLKLLKDLLNSGLDTVEEIMTGVTALELKAKALRKELANRGSDTITDAPLEIKNPQFLYTGKTLTYPKASLFTAVAAFASHIYPNEVAKYYGEIASAVNKYNPAAGNAEDFIKQVDSKASPVSALGDERMEVPGGVITINKAEHSWSVAEGTVTKWEGHDIEITPSEYPTDVKIPARNKSAIEQTLTIVEKTIDLLKQSGEAQRKVKTSATEVLKELEKMHKYVKDQEMDEASASEAKKVAESTVKLVRVTNPGHKDVIKYIVRGLNAYLGVLKQETLFLKNKSE